jgi:hypothetical protein
MDVFRRRFSRPVGSSERPPHDAAHIRQADVVVGCAIASFVNPQQVLPLPEVALDTDIP